MLKLWSMMLVGAYDARHPERAGVTASARAASIDTDNEKRDGHLRSPDFFDADHHPEITLTSTTVHRTEEGLLVEGIFTMHGVKKKVSIPVEVMGEGIDPMGRQVIGFAGEFTFDRLDFGITWNKTLDRGGMVVGNKVKVMLTIEAVRREGPAEA